MSLAPGLIVESAGADESIELGLELELGDVDPAPVPIELDDESSDESSSFSISEDEDGTLVEPEPIPEPVPVLASEPIVDDESIELSEAAPEPIDVESVEDEDDVVVFANAGTAIAATTSDVQINFFIKPP